MYESPVTLIYQDIERQINQKQEETILAAIRGCGVVVDKNELIKAINYDRNQYSKGYKDGVNDVLDKIMAEITELRSRQNVGVLECLDIINKYRAERSDKE